MNKMPSFTLKKLLARLMATILGENDNLAERADLVHYFGKSIDDEIEGIHVEIESDIAKKYKENEVVINTIESQTNVIARLQDLENTAK